jgi:hypothetical protein
MESVMVSVVVFSVLIVFLCIPPFMALQMLVRRAPFAKPTHRQAYRLAIGFAASALAFNLVVSTFFAPRLVGATLAEALGPTHLVAIGLSWLCFWGAIALAFLIRRRRSFVY